MPLDFVNIVPQNNLRLPDALNVAYGPARDKQGNFYVTLNVGFGGGHQSRAPWRGWCVKITPRGDLIPIATGLRSPNGVNLSPDGDLFFTDNQGEWVATCKLQHVRPGEFYGHPAGLRWIKYTPFAGKLSEKVASGMLYDGQPGQDGVRGMPPVTPPAIWFPYGRMGQSASEPIWDTTGGKFGPFAGQCFVGDQTKSMVMRVYGLQRLVYTGVLPFEIQSMKLTRDGFALVFTKPLDPATANRPAAYSLQSFTHHYWSTYGSPEVDRRAEKVQRVKVSADRRAVSLAVTGFRPGRVYELHLDGVKAADGTAILHPEAYYTLNELP